MDLVCVSPSGALGRLVVLVPLQGLGGCVFPVCGGRGEWLWGGGLPGRDGRGSVHTQIANGLFRDGRLCYR
ncbi:hypothetical protein RKD37_008556 [Streptomyces ambofaciens]